jgi:hypothetical protein
LQTLIRPFISYAREDSATAIRLYRDLRALGAEPWLDLEELVGGQRWQEAIREALAVSTHFIALLSERSVNKRGFVQKELADALEILKEFPPDAVYVIPVRLDNTRPKHDGLRQLHWIDLFDSYEDGLQAIAKSLKLHPSDLSPNVVSQAFTVPDDVEAIIVQHAREEAGGNPEWEMHLRQMERDAWHRLRTIAPPQLRPDEVDRILNKALETFPEKYALQLFRVQNEITSELNRRAESAGKNLVLKKQSPPSNNERAPGEFYYAARDINCPQCGGPAVYEIDDDPNHMSAAITCRVCGFETADGW